MAVVVVVGVVVVVVPGAVDVVDRQECCHLSPVTSTPPGTMRVAVSVEGLVVAVAEAVEAAEAVVRPVA